jgi:murein L,D-transpeptidase YcbB/YkuD
VEAPAANAATEAEVGNKIREIITGKQFDRMVARKPDRDAIVALYQKARNFQPLWVAQGAASERAKDVIEYLGTIEADGLDPKDYRMPKLNVGSAEEQAQAELKFTETLLTYARHAMTGRVHFSRVSPNIDYKLAFDADDVLKKIAASNDLGKTLAQFNPPQPGYRALKAKLAEMREALDEPVSSRVENGPVLRYTRDSRGKETVMADPRVPLLRERLGLAAEPNTNYNAALAMAVGKLQKANGIQVTGQLNGPTIEAINGPSRVKKLDARYHGTLALDAARPRQDARRAQHPGLFRSRLQQRREGLANPHGRWKAGERDAAADRDDEVHHAQSDLERPGVDHLQ